MRLPQSRSAGEAHPLGVSPPPEVHPAARGTAYRALSPGAYRKVMRGPRPSEHTMRKLRVAVFTRDKFTCQRCGWTPDPVTIGSPYDGRTCPAGPAPEPRTPREARLAKFLTLTLGHLIPASEGGAYEEANMQAECSRCNYGGGNTIRAAHDRGLTSKGTPWPGPPGGALWA